MVTRPLKEGERRKLMNVTIHPDILQGISDAAWSRRKTLSRMVNDILGMWLEAQNEGSSEKESNLAVGSQ